MHGATKQNKLEPQNATERQFFKHVLAWHLLHGCACRSDTVGTHASISIVLKRRRPKATHLIIKASFSTNLPLERTREFLSFYRRGSKAMNNSKWIYICHPYIYIYGAGCWKAPEDFYRFMTSRIEGHVLTNGLQQKSALFQSKCITPSGYVNSRSFSFFCSGVNTHAVVFVGIRVNTQNYIDEDRH